jgi:hypothetical protein
MSFVTTKSGYIGTKPMPHKTEEEILIQVEPMPPTGVRFKDEIEVNEEAESIEPLLPPTFETFKNSNR